MIEASCNLTRAGSRTVLIAIPNHCANEFTDQRVHLESSKLKG